MSNLLVEKLVWVLGPSAQFLIAVMMVRSGLKKQFPFFFHYTVYQVVSAGVLFLLYKNPMHYFYGYWISSALSVLLGFCVLYELFAFIVRPYVGLRDLAMLLFRWATTIIIIMSGVVGVSTHRGAAQEVMAAVVTLERTVRLMQCGMLVFIVLCSQYLGLSWRSFATGIAAGFGIFAATDLLVSSLVPMMPKSFIEAASLWKSSVYQVSVFIWLAYSALPQPARQRLEIAYQPIFDRWNQAALNVMAPHLSNAAAVEHTYLSDIERAVENVLSHSNQ